LKGFKTVVHKKALLTVEVAALRAENSFSGKITVKLHVIMDVSGISALVFVDDASNSAEPVGTLAFSEVSTKDPGAQPKLEQLSNSDFEFSTEEEESSKESIRELERRERLKGETEEAKNNLEAYIFELKDLLSTSERYTTQAERDELRGILEDSERILSESDIKKAKYVDELAHLKVKGAPVSSRIAAHHKQEEAVQACKDFIKIVRAKVQEFGAKKKKLGGREQQLVDMLAALEAWLAEKQNTQQSSSLYLSPVFTAEEVYEQMKSLEADYRQLITGETKPVVQDQFLSFESKMAIFLMFILAIVIGVPLVYRYMGGLEGIQKRRLGAKKAKKEKAKLR